MGAWGIGAFENDGAGDLVAALRHQGLDLLGSAFDLPDGEYLEVDQGQEVIAAAEIVAAAFGQAAPGLPPDVQQFVAQHGVAIRARTDLPARALRALARVTADDSEIQDLWAEVDDGRAWSAALQDLEGRLRAIR